MWPTGGNLIVKILCFLIFFFFWAQQHLGVDGNRSLFQCIAWLRKVFYKYRHRCPSSDKKLLGKENLITGRAAGFESGILALDSEHWANPFPHKVYYYYFYNFSMKGASTSRPLGAFSEIASNWTFFSHCTEAVVASVRQPIGREPICSVALGASQYWRTSNSILFPYNQHRLSPPCRRLLAIESLKAVGPRTRTAHRSWWAKL